MRMIRVQPIVKHTNFDNINNTLGCCSCRRRRRRRRFPLNSPLVFILHVIWISIEFEGEKRSLGYLHREQSSLS